MEVVGVLLFIWVFGAICNALLPGFKQREADRVAAKFREAREKKQADHLSTARLNPRG